VLFIITGTNLRTSGVPYDQHIQSSRPFHLRHMTSHYLEVIAIGQVGDAIITLEDFSRPFAVWERHDAECPSTDDTDGSVNKATATPGRERNNDTIGQQQDETPASNETILTILSKGVGPDLPSHDDETNQAPTRQGYKVSSHHLISASAKFRSELTGNWGESCRDSNGLYQLTASGWDAEAFRIMLDVFHLRYRQIPKELSLDLLAKVAMLVDYYRCREAFDLLSPLWIEAARKNNTVPATYNRNVLLWLLIAWVFKMPEEFTKTTAIVVRQSEEADARDMELGIPQPILGMNSLCVHWIDLDFCTDALRQTRLAAIEKVIGLCHLWLDCWGGNYRCPRRADSSFVCSSMLLGALTKEMKRLNIFLPRPQAPFAGWSFEKLCQEVQSMKSPTWIDESSRNRHKCTLETTIRLGIDALLVATGGLKLDGFKDRVEEDAGLGTVSS
jgi:hypothetical protein